MFEEQCSIYRSAKDRDGIGQMSVGDFLFTDRWREPVMRLREMIDRYGPLEAKRRDDYRRMKQQLPGATLSGLFSRRKTDCLISHTGYIAIDIDLGDNRGLSDFGNIEYVLRHRPEVSCFLKSCSGTGYFALVRLGYPEQHKEQFRALSDEYSALGIALDRACSDITRIRFATYDEHPYINERSICYRGIDLGRQVLAPRAAVLGQGYEQGASATADKVDRLISELERHRIDITAAYNDWVRVGFALATLGEHPGREFFHRVSALNPGYKPQECDRKFTQLMQPSRIHIGTFIAMCKDYGVV